MQGYLTHEKHDSQKEKPSLWFIRSIDAVPLEEREKISEYLNVFSFSKPVAKAGVMRRKM